MGREQRRRAAQSARQKTSHQAPPPGIERRQTLVEQFASEHVQVIEVLPEEDAGYDVAQVALQMLGRPAHHTRAGKMYLTFFMPEIALQIGEGLVESARTLLQRGTPQTLGSGLVAATSMRDVAAVAEQQRQVEEMRADG